VHIWRYRESCVSVRGLGDNGRVVMGWERKRRKRSGMERGDEMGK